MTQDAMKRALSRLHSGQRLYLLPSGQWKFGGNKFLPNRIAAKLPIEPEYTNNHGWVAHWFDENTRRSLSGEQP